MQETNASGFGWLFETDRLTVRFFHPEVINISNNALR